MKYRGSDGWLHDESAEPKRYKNKASTQGPSKPGKKRPRLSKCPNCPFSVTWRKEQGHCDNCGWGKKQEDWDSYTPLVTPSGDGALACCGFLGVVVVLTLICMGIGYGVGGFGGLMAGLGLGLALPTGVVILMASSGSKKEKK